MNAKNINYDKSKHSVITNHMFKKNNTFDWHNKKILDFETNYYKKLILEMIHIKSQKNGINFL